MAEPRGTQAPRLVSLDAFRGLAMAGMVLVNNPGDWSTVYPPLLHAPWHGWTPTDWIFPFFLFIVGVAMNFSRRASVGEAARRAAILILLGLLLAAYPLFHLTTLRWPGVLQRIGLTYFLAFLAARVLRPRGLAVLTAGLLLGYWALLSLVPVPGGRAPNLDAGTDLTSWVDRAVMGGHLWSQSRTWDPEGLLSSLPATATVLLGLLAGRWLRSPRGAETKVWGLLAGGAAAIAAGLVWGLGFPINKNLWTSSYALFTGGLAAAVLAVFYDLADRRGLRRWSRPLVVFGRNAILLFVGSGLLARTLGWLGWKQPLYQSAFASWLPPYPASLAFAIANLAFWYAVLWLLDRKQIYLHV
jgi:predicted acyltransferase